MKTLLALLFSLLISICFTPASSGAAIELKLNLRPGSSYRVRSESYDRMVQSMVGVEMEMSKRIVFYYTFTVQQVSPNGEFVLNVRHESVALELDGVRGDVRWDSNQQESPDHPLARGLAALVGESYTLRLNSEGTVLGVEGFDRINAKMAGEVEMPDGDNRAMVLDGLREMAGEEAQKELLGQLFGVYPRRPVEVGDSWAVNDSNRMLQFSRHGTMTLNGLEGSQALIGMDAALTTGGQAMQRSLGPLMVEMELEGTQTGTFQMDLDSGWITHREIRSDINGSYSLIDGPELFSGRKMPVIMESRITWEPF